MDDFMGNSEHILPDTLRGRSIHTKVIPTMCNVKNMLNKLVLSGGDFNQLKQWEKRSYIAYKIDDIKNDIINSDKSEWPGIIRSHILSKRPPEFGASVIDIYLVAYVAENFHEGRETFFKYIKQSGISDNEKSAQAIWQVGKGDGIFLDILYNNGRIKDWKFIYKWILGK